MTITVIKTKSGLGRGTATLEQPNQDHPSIILTINCHLYNVSIRATLLAVIVVGCCFVSIVSAVEGCNACSACSATPQGGLGAPDYSKDPYWGMSVDDIMNARSSAGNSDTSGSDYWHAPPITIPSSNIGKFASLFEYKSKFGDSLSPFSKNTNIPKPDTSIMVKPNFSANPDFDVKSNFINKQLFF